ncbi:expressed unknown protein [Seminavis robusta]|uniref:SAM domain-containing protein n=1 Tax=Seminavis robusta TaxID=568900 RepID=A0A9N8HEH2_9STRA|nr:expressed unknown protein [Seminavis robusta]|eukprot:Sro472_g150040.1 n/a (159) ;mRNA; f:62451-62927
MGADQSIPLLQWTCDDVASGVASLGHQYTQYTQIIRDQEIDGPYLTGVPSDEIDEGLTNLGVSSRLHKRVLSRKLAALRSPASRRRSLIVSRSNSFDMPPAAGLRRTGTLPSQSERERLLQVMQMTAVREQREHENLLKREAALLSQIATLDSTAAHS